MKRILGIDPALAQAGWGVIEVSGSALKFIACGEIKTNAKQSMCERLGVLATSIRAIIKEYDPDEVAIEETFVNTNGQSTLKLGQARGALIAGVAGEGVAMAEYAARLVKKAVTGNGAAEKQQIVAMVKMLMPAAIITSEDAADALAVAICHANHN